MNEIALEAADEDEFAINQFVSPEYMHKRKMFEVLKRRTNLKSIYLRRYDIHQIEGGYNEYTAPHTTFNRYLMTLQS